MLKNPIVKFIGMFVVGCAAVAAVEWIVSLVKGTPYVFDWVSTVGLGLLIAVLDRIFPAEKRRENRQKLKDSFKR